MDGNALARASHREVVDEGQLAGRRSPTLGQGPGRRGEQPAAVPGHISRVQTDLPDGAAHLARPRRQPRSAITLDEVDNNLAHPG